MPVIRSSRLALLLVVFGGLAVFGQDQPPADAAPAIQGTSSADTASLPDLKPDAKGKLSQEQMQHLFRVVADKDIENTTSGCAITPTSSAMSRTGWMARGKPSPPK
ncbi:MAG: hypothetical protein WCA49_12100 [Candidatus Sulfotelmatobacter sp.]